MFEKALDLLQLPWQPIPGSDLLPLFSRWRRQLATGLVQCSVEGAGDFYLLLARGDLLYLQHPVATLDVQDAEAWAERMRLSGKKASYRYLALNVLGLRPVRILLENQAPARSRPLQPAARLEGLLGETGFTGQLSVLLASWPENLAIAMYPEGNLQAGTLLVSPNQLVSSSDGLQAALDATRQPALLEIFPFQPQSPAWQEAVLAQAFSALMNQLWAACRQADASRELSSLRQSLNFLHSANGWQAHLSETGFTNQMIFPSAAEAARVYQRILDELLRCMAGLLGEKAVASLAGEVVRQMGEPLQETLDRFLVSQPRQRPSADRRLPVRPPGAPLVK